MLDILGIRSCYFASKLVLYQRVLAQSFEELAFGGNQNKLCKNGSLKFSLLRTTRAMKLQHRFYLN